MAHSTNVMALIKRLASAAFLVLAGCATLPERATTAVATAIPMETTTRLGGLAAASASASDAGLSGFRLMPTGDFSLATRIALADRAERTLDLQYYQVQDDEVGRAVLRAVADAAKRGVRVRFLIDDLYSSGEDDLLRAFAAIPNVEVRLFNPFPSGRGSLTGRFAASLLDFSRVDHRMHNKLFIADGAFAVAGGRNLGNEYFGTALDNNFVDIDALVTGALLPRLSELFDTYWNSPYAWPIERIVETAASPQRLQDDFDRFTSESTTPHPRPPPPNDVLGYSPISEDFGKDRLELIWAQAEAFADSPDRVVGKRTTYGGADLLDIDGARYNVIEQIRRARSDVTVISPYLIPGPDGLDEIAILRRRGVKMTLITNSLASTDEPYVYTAYRHYRPRLLRLGVDVFELGSTRSGRSARLGIFGTAKGRLHAKSAVIDGKVLFLGSMNFDPRSANENTELCLIVQSGELAEQQLRLLRSLMKLGAYRLSVSGVDGSVHWASEDASNPVVETVDPDTTFWERTIPSILSPLIPESLL